MKKILILSDNDDIKDYIKSHILSEFNIKLLECLTTKEAFQKIINDKNEVGLIIAKYELKDHFASELYFNLSKENIKIPFILLTAKYPSADKNLEGFLFGNVDNAYLKFPLRNDELIEMITTIIKLRRPSTKEGYRRIKLNQLQILIKSKTAFFILDHHENYIKIEIDATQDSLETLNNLKQENHDFLFIKSEDYENFLLEATKDLQTKLNSSGVKVIEKLKAQFDSVENIHQSLWNIGISHSEIELANTIVTTAHNIINRQPKVSKIIAKLMNKNNYTYQLAMLTSYMSSAIFMKSDWFSKTISQKLALASILQDISLEHDEHAKIINKKEMAIYPEDIQKIIKNHPQESVKYLDDLKEISNDTKNLILNHHERPDGSGFPREETLLGLSPLSCIFIIAHEFSHRLIIKPLTQKILEDLLIEFNEKYSHGNFRKPFESFKKVFKK